MTQARVRATDGPFEPAREEHRSLAALRAGDEGEFARLVDAHGAAMLRVASLYVANRQAAEEVVQETWLAVCTGLARFEGRSSLKTWIFQILVNRARTRGLAESRTVPFSAFVAREVDGEPAVEPHRFHAAERDDAGLWVSHPRSFDSIPEHVLESDETVAIARRAIDALGPAQRAVITLRDVDGFEADEVCAVLGLSAANQRVLLHRARSRVRRALEAYLDG